MYKTFSGYSFMAGIIQMYKDRDISMFLKNNNILQSFTHRQTNNIAHLLDSRQKKHTLFNIFFLNQKSCWYLTELSQCLFVCLILFFTSHQQSFSYKGTGLPGLIQY